MPISGGYLILVSKNYLRNEDEEWAHLSTVCRRHLTILLHPGHHHPSFLLASSCQCHPANYDNLEQSQAIIFILFWTCLYSPLRSLDSGLPWGRLPLQNKINQKWPNWSDNTSPPIVKHVLAPQNEFGMPKTIWSNYKRSGTWVDPPCFFSSNSDIFPFFVADVP